jgi:(p)ppGpp synthase/HD superfamily hydrolase
MMSFTSHIRLLAAGAHAAVGQKYGDLPYVAHLDQVVAILRESGFDTFLHDITGFLHDIIEDTKVTAEDLTRFDIPQRVIRAVEFLSDEEGHNRKTRKANTYKRVQRDIAAGGEHISIGLAVKWADRIANLRASTQSNPGLLKMYRKEWEVFRTAYMPPDLAPGIDGPAG